MIDIYLEHGVVQTKIRRDEAIGFGGRSSHYFLRYARTDRWPTDEEEKAIRRAFAVEPGYLRKHYAKNGYKGVFFRWTPQATPIKLFEVAPNGAGATQYY